MGGDPNHLRPSWNDPPSAAGPATFAQRLSSDLFSQLFRVASDGALETESEKTHRGASLEFHGS